MGGQTRDRAIQDRFSAGEPIMDAWTGRKIGLPDGAALTREALKAYQLAALQKTLRHAKEKSAFYREKLAEIDVKQDIQSLSDLEKIPFTTQEELRENGIRMVCVPQSEVSRIVTLDTSGSTGQSKRIYFTAEDQELTADFFHYGMKNLVDETDVLLILLPCARPGSVGDILRQGLERGGTKTIPYGAVPRDGGAKDAEVLELIRNERVTSLVGGPVEIARLARGGAGCGETVRSVLLSTEYVSDENRRAIEQHWDCKVFEHYGMTESGLGGAVACPVREGYHPREADLLFEVIQPETGTVLPDGAWGELVFTTLTRRAMPFIRYRTGDVSRWMPEPCACGSKLKRLDKVQDRAAVKRRVLMGGQDA
jgi:phenylacetate-coenzyme A ligase PaaK-like adenylate-forming protein